MNSELSTGILWGLQRYEHSIVEQLDLSNHTRTPIERQEDAIRLLQLRGVSALGTFANAAASALISKNAVLWIGPQQVVNFLVEFALCVAAQRLEEEPGDKLVIYLQQIAEALASFVLDEAVPDGSGLDWILREIQTLKMAEEVKEILRSSSAIHYQMGEPVSQTTSLTEISYHPNLT